MPNDAKLGLVVGVGVVITIAVVFFRKDGTTPIPLTSEATAAAVSPRKASTLAPVQALNPSAKTDLATPTPGKTEELKPTSRRHEALPGQPDRLPESENP